MRYDFDTPVDRHNTGAVKWDFAGEAIPMWVADMDFKTAPEIVNALEKRISHGVYGYTYPGPNWSRAYISFWKQRYGFTFEEKDIVFALGVVAINSSSVRAFTKIGDNVVVTTPVYNIFFNSIRNNGRNVLDVPLLRKGDDYLFDFAGLEKAFADPKTSLFILCNPQNPVGKNWSKEELARVGELASKHGVVVVSDEIHGPLSRPGTSYIPFASINEVNANCAVTAISPTKAFNLAGIQTAAVVATNEELRKKIERQLNTDEVAETNILSCLAAEVAFNQGGAWLDELRAYLFANRDYAESYIKENMKGLHPIPGDATYLMWIELDEKHIAFADELSEKDLVKVSKGDVYGEGGKNFIRLNVACPRTQLEQALERMNNLYKQIR